MFATPDIPDATETTPTINLLPPDQIPIDSLSFLLNRNEKPDSVTYSILEPAYGLQTDEEEETNHLDEPEGPVDYWLDPEQITLSLAHLDLMTIYHTLVENRPFVTIESFQNEIDKAYQKHYHNTIGQSLIEPELVSEYLNRLFAEILPGSILDLTPSDLIDFPIDTITDLDQLTLNSQVFQLKVVKNRFNQLIVTQL